MYIQGGNQVSSETQPRLHSVRGEMPAVARRKSESVKPAVSINISDEGKTLAKDKQFQRKLRQLNAIAVPEVKKQDAVAVLDEGAEPRHLYAGMMGTKHTQITTCFQPGQTLEDINASDPALAAEYASFFKDETYEKFKADNPELIQQIFDAYKDWKPSEEKLVGIDLETFAKNQEQQQKTTASHMSTAERVAAERKKYMDENLSEAAKQMAKLLGEQSGKQIVCDGDGYMGYYDTSVKYYEMGSDLLEFMAAHSSQMGIWNRVVKGDYRSLGEIEEALLKNGSFVTAKDLREAVTPKPPSEELLRGTIASQISMKKIKLYDLEHADDETKRQSQIAYQIRRAYAESIASPEMIQKYQDYFGKQNEQRADVLFAQKFGSGWLAG